MTLILQNGTYLRNGPGLWDVGGHSSHHIFDGYATLVRISFRRGRATGAHRQVESDAYKAAMAHGRPLHLPASLDPPSLNKGPAWQGGRYVGSPAPGTSLLLLPVGGSGRGLPHPLAHGGATTWSGRRGLVKEVVGCRSMVGQVVDMRGSGAGNDMTSRGWARARLGRDGRDWNI